MTDIDAIIAAAKRVGTADERREDIAAFLTLMNGKIAMAEALARVQDLGEAIHLRDPAYCAGQMVEIVSECLNRIVKEANRD